MLGSGGLTGLAWQAGVLAGLSDAGVGLAADLVVGTSAGALLAARVAGDEPIGAVIDAVRGRAQRPTPGRITPMVLARLLTAQLYPSRRHAVAWLGRRAAAEWTGAASGEWVAELAAELSGRPWPTSLVVVATNASTGRPAFFSARQPADLALAVAASCAMPGVFPAVRIEDRLYFDGGLRSPANLDAAGSADAVLALAPLAGAIRAYRRPVHQAARLRASGASVVLLTPDAAGRRAIGVDVLAADRVDACIEAGRNLGAQCAGQVRAVWC